MFPDYRIP